MNKQQAFELCWIWDKYCSVDIAAWVQAIGSVLAIGLTVGLYWHQIYKTAQDKIKEREQKRAQQLSTAKMYFNELDILFDKVIDTSKETAGSKFVRIRYLAAQLEESSKWSRVLSTDTFLEHELLKFNKIRNAAFDLTNSIKHTENQFLFMREYSTYKDSVADEIAYFLNASI